MLKRCIATQAVALLMLASTANAADLTIKGTNYHQITEFHSGDVIDTEGHIVALHKNVGATIHPDGTHGELSIVGTLNWEGGLGPIHGYVNIKYPDESTLVMEYRSTYRKEGEKVIQEGDFLSCSGSGRYAGITGCAGKWANRTRHGKLIVSDWEVTATR